VRPTVASGSVATKERALRVAIVAGPDPGHIFPSVAIGVALSRRGSEVLVGTSERWADDLTAAGLGFVALPELPPDPRDVDFAHRMYGRGAEMAPLLAGWLQDFGTDVVIADTLTLPGAFAAELIGRPWVEVLPHWLSLPSRALPPPGLGQRPARTPIGRLREARQRRDHGRSWTAGLASRASARRALGLSGSGLPDARLVAGLPALEPPRPDWPARTFVVGALEWDPPSWPVITPPEGDAPLVLATESTASGPDLPLVARTLAGLADSDVRVVATVDGPLDGPAPSATVSGRSAHSPLLDVCDVAVGSPGGGFVAKALRRGVPLVVVPVHGDQRETAARVERAGAGIALTPRQATPRALGRAVMTVLGDGRFRAAAAELARGAERLGADYAALIVERTVSAARPVRRASG